MLIEIKSKDLTTIEVQTLIARAIRAKSKESPEDKEKIKAMLEKLEALGRVAEGLYLTSLDFDLLTEKNKKDEYLIFSLHHNLCIKIIWEEIMQAMSDYINYSGSTTIDIDELKDLKWTDIKSLCFRFRSAYDWVKKGEKE